MSTTQVFVAINYALTKFLRLTEDLCKSVGWPHPLPLGPPPSYPFNPVSLPFSPALSHLIFPPRPPLVVI